MSEYFDEQKSDCLREYPIVIRRREVFLPGVITHFDTSDAAEIAAVEHAMREDGRIVLTAQKDPDKANPTISDIYSRGVLVKIKQLVKIQNDELRAIIDTRRKVQVLRLVPQAEYQSCVVLFAQKEADAESSEMQEAMLRSLREAVEKYGQMNPKFYRGVKHHLEKEENLERFLALVSNNLPLSYKQRQSLLECDTLTGHYETLHAILTSETEVLSIKRDINQKVKEKVDKNQREYILREEIKVIRKELGEDNADTEAETFARKLEELDADPPVKERIQKEIKRFKNVSGSASEASVARGYIETLLDLPWNKKSEDNTDLNNAERILEEDHYGLEKVKERILEFLAVRALTRGGASPIICLVGPPGTGKTSIAKSVAAALDKHYIRISLGGVRDEAEIRGHRRTYVGAMPGRIIQALRQAGVKNPLMLLDEIDKMSSDYKGDTASAMLEVLDAEQNARFMDHYIDMPVDLSEVLFIATANDVHTIPRPLLDRMELIEVSSYTENEKMHIAKEHLLPKQKQKNGIPNFQLTISDEAMAKIIAAYTREAGVRGLERKLGEICRKTARRIYEESEETVAVTEENLEEFLGKERFRADHINEQDEIGIVRGLAWTSVGGDTLQIEVNVMPGKGEFQLTGQLGDVMKESAQAGISYIRSVGDAHGIPEDFFKTHDIHIHIPEGAVPKDGPSAGITMATAMLSAITNRPVRADVAMTGEITLRGRVLPIGGLKEKLLAAKKAGIRTVCVPFDNRADVEEISGEIKDGLEICYVRHMEEVLKTALTDG